MEPRLRIVDNQQTCGNPWCPDKPDIVDHSDQASHFPDSDGDPTLCDCVHPKKHALHTKILLHINRLETLSDELILAYDVTGSMSNKSKGLKKIGLGVPLGDQTSELGALSLMVMDLRIDGKRIETASGRPLTMVWDPSRSTAMGAKFAAIRPQTAIAREMLALATIAYCIMSSTACKTTRRLSGGYD
ncbi:hypothetical protein LTS10_000312 [Elasticomyces elasticus]|nr:hypothetical protein LTS10_000312 [Elasticomyces elasticus]